MGNIRSTKHRPLTSPNKSFVVLVTEPVSKLVHESTDPNCFPGRLYATQKAMEIDRKSPEGRGFIVQMMDQLENVSWRLSSSFWFGKKSWETTNELRKWANQLHVKNRARSLWQEVRFMHSLWCSLCLWGVSWVGVVVLPPKH